MKRRHFAFITAIASMFLLWTGISESLTRQVNEIADQHMVLQNGMTILLKPNVLYLTISVQDELLHKENLSAQYTQEKEDLLEHFENIRKIHEHLIDETKIRNLPIIESERGKSTIHQVRKLVVEKIVSLVSL